MSDVAKTRCTDCSAEFTDEQCKGIDRCPTCGNPGVPCDIADDVTLRINWHELRILGIWASNYAGGKEFENERGQMSRRTLSSILKRLEAQFPEKPKLSLRGELGDLARATCSRVELHAGGKVEAFEGEKPS